MEKEEKLSSLEKFLLGIEQPIPVQNIPPLKRGEPCPRCNSARLDYNGVLQLECPACGFVSSEGGGCT